MQMIRFFRRIRLVPGLTLNLSKKGVSVSAGRKGTKFTFGRRRRATFGIPGTGLFWTTAKRQSKRKKREHQLEPASHSGRVWFWFYFALLVLWWLLS